MRSKILKSVILQSVILLGLILINFSVYARWATVEDAALLIEKYDIDTYINKDGSFVETTQIQYKILNENGRQTAAQYIYSYNADNESVQILDAKTIKNGITFKVDPKLIEDKPVASSSQSFDTFNQIKMSFPQADIGSSFFIKYTHTAKRPNLDNYVANRIYLGNGIPYDQANIKIRSELPLYIKVNDPLSVLKISNTTKTNNNVKEVSNSKVLKDLAPLSIQTIEISILKPLFQATISEPAASMLNDNKLTWVSISSLNDWEQFASKVTPAYEKVLIQPLPPELETIKNLASKQANPIDQINTVTTLLNEQIQYLGDWRSVSGRFFPHDLQSIVTSKLGDCKDFSVSAGAIFRQLGYKVHPALVRRGLGVRSVEGGLPDLADFNHVMLKLTSIDSDKTKSGVSNVYWVDPTNVVSMADGVFPDIAGKMVLVLDTDKPTYEKTPEVNLEHSKTVYTNNIEVIKEEVKYQGKAVLHGEKSLQLAGAGLYASPQSVKDMLFTQLSGEHLEEIAKKQLTVPPLNSRVVSDIEIDYEFYQNNKLIRTNLGNALKLSGYWVDNITSTLSDQKSDLFIGHPETIERENTFKNMKIKNLDVLNFKIDSPWVSVKRVSQYKGKDTVVKETVMIKENYIKSEDLASPEYQKLKKELNSFFREIIVVLP